MSGACWISNEMCREPKGVRGWGGVNADGEGE